MEYNWQVSPKTGERLWSSTELGSLFGISPNLLNKVLEKYGVLIKKDNQWRIVDESLGENCFFNTAHRYDDKASEHTTNVTVKFNIVGKNIIENFLSTKELYKITPFNSEFDELQFPEGKFALSIRGAGTKYNPNPNVDMLYISNRYNRQGSKFSRNYMFIPDDSAKKIKKVILNYGKVHRYNTKAHKVPIDLGSAEIVSILVWKDKYFSSILNHNGYNTRLSNEQIKTNIKKLKEYLND